MSLFARHDPTPERPSGRTVSIVVTDVATGLGRVVSAVVEREDRLVHLRVEGAALSIGAGELAERERRAEMAPRWDARVAGWRGR